MWATPILEAFSHLQDGLVGDFLQNFVWLIFQPSIRLENMLGHSVLKSIVLAPDILLLRSLGVEVPHHCQRGFQRRGIVPPALRHQNCLALLYHSDVWSGLLVHRPLCVYLLIQWVQPSPVHQPFVTCKGIQVVSVAGRIAYEEFATADLGQPSMGATIVEMQPCYGAFRGEKQLREFPILVIDALSPLLLGWCLVSFREALHKALP
mmetsp:Transcript_26871/g.56945  ORF Transcript_26871/g.56945 Transcript_26871/m.56945 type:complete len:207 (+) Transcript_26871:220-840(+)